MAKIRIPLIIITLLLTMLSGCSNFFSSSNDNEETPQSNLPASAIYTNNNAIHTLTISLISHAQKHIYVQLSALDDQEIIDLLIAKSHAGVETRLLLDQWQRENTATIKTLKNANVSVQYYPAEKGQYQRVRYLVVDDQTAVFYGKDWSTKGYKYKSMAVKLTGDSVSTLAKSFRKDWTYTTTLSLDSQESATLTEDNITFAITVNVKTQILSQIDSAATDIKIITEQLSEQATIDALIAAKKRGCNIKIIVSPSSVITSPDAVASLKEAQIDLRYYKDTDKASMGYNFGIFDDKTFLITNSSWTRSSFVIYHVGSLTIPSPAATQKVNTLFEQEWKTSTSS